MAKTASPPTGGADKKQRTQGHIIADRSVNHVERLVLKCGCVLQRPTSDYGYDVRMETFDENGEIEAEQIPVQLKATGIIERYELTGEDCYSYPISAKDYRHWKITLIPVFLILYDAKMEEGYWLHIQDYDKTIKPEIKGDTINLRIPRHQILGVQTIRMMRQRKNERVQSYYSAFEEEAK